MDRSNSEAGIELEQKRFGTVNMRLDKEIAAAGFERDFSQRDGLIGLGKAGHECEG